jgi:hypothetical protein
MSMLIGLQKLGRDPPKLALVLGALAVTALTCILPGAIWLSTYADLHAEKQHWTIKGPACPIVAQMPQYLTHRRRPLTTFVYGSTEFTRVTAMVYCTQVPDNPAWPTRNYEICQFNNPGTVKVRTGGETTIFQPPPGGRATITVDKGKATCVVGGWFNL